jgi:hypothetical protein
MTAVKVARLVSGPFERLSSALIDAKRCDRAVLLLLVGYAATWTLYGSIARSSQDLHPDMTELISWFAGPQPRLSQASAPRSMVGATLV